MDNLKRQKVITLAESEKTHGLGGQNVFVCVCIHSVHTLSSHCSFDLQKAVVKDFLTGHKCLAADQSTHCAMRLVTKRRDPRPKYFLPSVAIHRSSNIRPPPIYSFLPTSAPSSVTSLMGGHRDWSPSGMGGHLSQTLTQSLLLKDISI